jgi:hypothetical protein
MAVPVPQVLPAPHYHLVFDAICVRVHKNIKQHDVTSNFVPTLLPFFKYVTK